ncbi:MAG: class II aldolase/adducin family protein, partial [Planctomycetaceae bacterium]|nr:class II aldolase/adducin family protein [Planctomycetaceae bacterium]
ILLISRDLGRVDYFNKNEAEDLLKLKQQWNIDDPRIDMKNCELCANDVFRDSWKETGVGQRAFSPPTFKKGDGSPSVSANTPVNTPATADQEALVQAITDRVLAALNQAR